MSVEACTVPDPLPLLPEDSWSCASWDEWCSRIPGWPRLFVTPCHIAHRRGWWWAGRPPLEPSVNCLEGNEGGPTARPHLLWDLPETFRRQCRTMRAIALMLVYTPLALSLAAFDGFPSINPIRPGLPSAPSAIKRARHDAPHGKLSGWQHIYHGAHQSAQRAWQG